MTRMTRMALIPLLTLMTLITRYTHSSMTLMTLIPLQVGPRARIAILGANGAGKSTLLTALAGGARADTDTAAAATATDAAAAAADADAAAADVGTFGGGGGADALAGGGVQTTAGDVRRQNYLRVACMQQDHLEKLNAHLDSAALGLDPPTSGLWPEGAHRLTALLTARMIASLPR